MRRFKLFGRIYNIPEEGVKQFLETYPDAEEYFGESSEKVTEDVTKLSDDDAVVRLNSQYGDLGFSFETAGLLSNKVKVTNFDGTISETFDFNNWTDAGRSKVASDLNDWMSANAAPNTDPNFAPISGEQLHKQSTLNGAFNIEESAVVHLNNLYRDKGVWFEEISPGSDEVRVHKGGKHLDVKLPNNISNINQENARDWDIVASKISNFATGVSITPVYEGQMGKFSELIERKLDEPGFLESLGITDWEYAVKREVNQNISKEEAKYNVILKALKSKAGTEGIFGFGWNPNDDYSQLKEKEIDRSIEQAVNNRYYAARNARLVAESNQLANFLAENIEEDVDGRKFQAATIDDIHELYKQKSIKEFSKEGKKLFNLVEEWKKLNQQRLNGVDVKRSDIQKLESQIRTARNNYTNWYTTASSFVDRDGNPISPVQGEKLVGGYMLTEEDRDNSRQDVSKRLQFSNIDELRDDMYVDKFISDKMYNKMEKIVINNHEGRKLLEKAGYRSSGTTDLGYIYEVPFGFLAENYKEIIKGDTALPMEGKKFKSDPGYFGLFEFDKQQSKQGAKGDYGDIEEYTEGKDFSQRFKQSLKTYKSERKKLISDLNTVNEMSLLNIDPASKISGKGAVVENVGDFFMHMGGILVESTGRIFDRDFEIDDRSKSVQAELEKLKNIPDYEMTEAQLEASKKNMAYEVAEGVTGFVPAIAEFAAIEFATAGLGSQFALSKLGMRLLKTEKSIKAFEKAYDVKRGTKEFDKAVKTLGLRSLDSTKLGKVLIPTAKVLNEELKMGIVMGPEDYHVGSGAAFYGVGQLMQRLLPKAAGSRWEAVRTFIRNGSSGAMGVKAGEELHALIEDMRGNESYMKHIEDAYGDMSQVGRDALVEFLVFSLVGFKGTIDSHGGKWLGFRSNRQLDTLLTESLVKSRELNTDRLNILKGRKFEDLDPGEKKKVTDLESRIDNWIQVQNGVMRRINIINRNIDFKSSPEKATKQMNERFNTIIEEMSKMRTSNKDGEPIKFKVVRYRKDGDFKDKDSAAEFDGKNTIWVDAQRAEWGKIPHEVNHVFIKQWFGTEKGKLVAEKFKLELIENLKPIKFRGFAKKNGEYIDKDGKVIDKRTDFEGTPAQIKAQKEAARVYKEFSIEDYILNEYSNRKDFHDIKANEFISYTMEALADPMNRDKVLGGGIMTRMHQSYNRLLERGGGGKAKLGENLKGLDLVRFMSNLSMDLAGGKVTSRQLEKFKELLSDPVLDNHINKVDKIAKMRETVTKNQEPLSSKVNEFKRQELIERKNKLETTKPKDWKERVEKTVKEISELRKTDQLQEVTESNKKVSLKNDALLKEYNKVKLDKKETKKLSLELAKLEDKARSIGEARKEGYIEEIRKLTPRINEIKEGLKKSNKIKEDILQNNKGIVNRWLFGDPKTKTPGVIDPAKSSQAELKEIKSSADIEVMNIIDSYKPSEGAFGKYLIGALRGKTGNQRLGNILKRAGIDLDVKMKTVSRDAPEYKEKEGEGYDFEAQKEKRKKEEKELKEEIAGKRILKEDFKLNEEQISRVESRLEGRDWYKEDLITVDNVAKDIISEVMGNTITEKINWITKGDNWKVALDAVSKQSFSIARLDLPHRVGSKGSAQMSTKLKGTVVRDIMEPTGETVSLKIEGSTQNLPIQRKKTFTRESFLRDVLHVTFDAKGKLVSVNADSALGKKRKKAFNNLQYEMGRGFSIQLSKDVIKRGEASGDIVIKTTLQDLINKVQDGKSPNLASKYNELIKEAQERKPSLFRVKSILGEDSKEYKKLEKDILLQISDNKKLATSIYEAYDLTPAKLEKIVVEQYKRFRNKELREELRKAGFELNKDVAGGKDGYINKPETFVKLANYLNKNLKLPSTFFYSMLLDSYGVKKWQPYNSWAGRKILKEQDISWETINEIHGQFLGLSGFGTKTTGDKAGIILSNALKDKIRRTNNKDLTPIEKAEEIVNWMEGYLNDYGTSIVDAYKNNKKVRKDLAGSLHDYVYKGGDKKLINERFNDVANFLAQQTYIPYGIWRATNPVTSFTTMKGKVSDQHIVQVLNQSVNTVKNIAKYKSKDKFIKDFVLTDKYSNRSFTTEKNQKLSDKSGRTTYEGPMAKGVKQEFQLIVDPKQLSENFIIDVKGKKVEIKTWGDSLIEQLSGKSLDKLGHLSSKDLNHYIKEVQAILEGQKTKKKKRGITVWDFDDTIARTKSNVLFTDPKGKKGKLNAEEFAKHGKTLLDQGFKFDFSEFNKVIDGKKGPFFDKALKRNEKFGNKDVFILTARPGVSANAIHEFLKGIGLEIPLENIKGLGNSTAEAKAKWMVGKVAEGYNDFYFADDAIKNTNAVKNVLNQFDVKSKVQLAQQSLSSKRSEKFNKILEDVSGMEAKKRFSDVKAKIRGSAKDKFEFFIPSSAEDFVGLMYKFMGKGVKGEKHQAWFKRNLLDPFEKGIFDLNNAKQKIATEYDVLKSQNKEAINKLKERVKDNKDFTYEQALRVHLFEKAGYDTPGLSKTDKGKLLEAVNSNPDLLALSHTLSKISRKKEGYIEPKKDWLTGDIQTDLMSLTSRMARAKYLNKWIENKNEIFSPENLNKIEAIHGTKYREALEDILYRMETGVNRNIGKDRFNYRFSEAMSNSVGAIMFANIRSATLQMLSTVNFVNWGHNNIFNVAKTFANPKQYWKDVTMIFNSNWAKQRRSGLKTDVNHVELAEAASSGSNKFRSGMKWLLQKGFMPTQIADSFAIATGGASYYRNTVKKYMKEGLTKKNAEKKAWLEFQHIAERTQQSARPDLISQQQASPLGRFILAFANTPMQYNRIIKKSFTDLKNGRGDAKAHISKIIYYGAMQNFIFSSLQAGLFTLLFDDTDENAIKQKEVRIANSMLDTVLRGSGFAGAGVSSLKNMLLEFHKQEGKGYNADHMRTVLQGLNFSPPLGSRVRKVYSGLTNYKYNKQLIEARGFNIDNPALNITGNVVEGLTNVPLARLVNKTNNVVEGLSGEHETWQSIALLMGWNRWDLGVENEEMKKLREQIKIQNRLRGKGKASVTRMINKAKKETRVGYRPYLYNNQIRWVRLKDKDIFERNYPEAELIK